MWYYRFMDNKTIFRNARRSGKSLTTVLKLLHKGESMKCSKHGVYMQTYRRTDKEVFTASSDYCPVCEPYMAIQQITYLFLWVIRSLFINF